jgi:hypothetical protein
MDLMSDAQDLTPRLKSVRQGLKKWSRNISKLNSIIDSCEFVLAMMDGLEDQRPLSLQDYFLKCPEGPSSEFAGSQEIILEE